MSQNGTRTVVALYKYGTYDLEMAARALGIPESRMRRALRTYGVTVREEAPEYESEQKKRVRA